MSEAIPLVDATDIIRLVGQATFERGKEYAREHRVVDLDYDADKRLVIGHILGGETLPYEATSRLTQTHGQYSRPVLTTCTCPMKTDCKHVAAMLLAANQATATGMVAADAEATKAAEALDDAQDQRNGPSPEPVSADPAPSWRALIDGLSSATTPPRPRLTPMGLQFELRERTRERSGRWGAATTRPATEASARRAEATAAGSAASPFRLGVRPVTQSSTGNWVRGSLTWTSLPYSLNRLAVSPEQHRWFGQFQALHRSARDVYVPGEADWLYLDDFASPLLWPLLDEGRRLGIGFVTGKREVDVEVAASASVEITASQSDDGLRLAATGVIGQSVHPAFHTGLVADHGLYAWSFEPALHVALGPAAVGDDVRRLLTETPLIEVPAAEAQEFMTAYFPRLAGAVPVVSRDRSVELPEILPPVLHLVATFRETPTEKDVLDLAWSWNDNGTVKPLSAFEAPDDVEVVNATLKGLGAAQFAAEVLPLLQERDDLRVDIVGDRPDYRELTAEPTLTLTTVETDRRDWFDLGVMVTVEGRTIPFAPLFTALSKRQDKMLLVDRSYLSLKHPVFDELKRLISEAEELDEWETGELHINRYQVSLWAELDDLADHTEQDERWRATVDGLRSIESIPPVEVPSTVDATLRPYQREGFSWLTFLYEHGLGGVLADDMGLGKTLQTLALVAHSRLGHTAHAPGSESRGEAPGGAGSRERRPFLVVAPTSVVGNWVAEAARFTPSLRVEEVTATAAKSRVDLNALVDDGVDVVVTSYALFRIDFARYQAVDWAGLVLDEAQMIKNRASKAHRAAVELRAPFKLAITGTPMENDLMDIWSLFHVVAPGLLMSGLHFTEEYAKPISLGDRPELLARLRRRIRPLMLRRTKELVAPDLPEKQEQLLTVELAPKHRKLYDLFLQRERQKLLGLVDDLDRNRFIVFRSLTLLRMLALDATLVDGEAYEGIPSSKLDVLMEELADVIAGGHRALVFSQFTSYLSIVAARFDRDGVDYEYLDGATTQRSEVVARFREGTAPVFLISLKAGGFGLNLTEADYVFLLDPWWNPASEAQAVDRTHRIGQTSNVMVYRMIAQGTIEEKVMTLKEQKAKLFDAVMHDDEAAFGASLTADDIRGLLGP